jgi:type I restriction-modification system DNA methylase subunit
MKLTNNQIEILREGKIEENRFYLQWQLDRKQYTDINKVLETIWLKWNRWKKAHIVEWMSEEELKDAIDDICETGEVETLQETIKKFQFYPTPKEVAEYLVKLADIQDYEEVVEPSAWDWAIVKVILELNKNIKLYANEIHRDRYLELTKILELVSQSDFLHFENMDFDKFVMNPPFSKSQDVKHILKAYELLRKWGRIVSVASSSIQWREWKLYDELRALNPEFIELPEWSFKESWTMVNSVIVILNK